MWKNLQKKNVSVKAPLLYKPTENGCDSAKALSLYSEFYGMLWPWNFLKYVSATQEVDHYLFLLVGLFLLYKYYIEKNVNSRYIWRCVIPVLHSEDLFFQCRFIYFIHFSCFNFSFFALLYGKSSITHIRNLETTILETTIFSIFFVLKNKSTNNNCVLMVYGMLSFKKLNV